MTRLNILLALAAVACAMLTVNAAHRARTLYSELDQEQKRTRQLDIEWGQLQLELSTVAAHPRIEKIARERLGMRPPAAGEVLALGSSR